MTFNLLLTRARNFNVVKTKLLSIREGAMNLNQIRCDENSQCPDEEQTHDDKREGAMTHSPGG